VHRIALLAACVLVLGGALSEAAGAAAPDFVPGRVLVRYAPGTAVAQRVAAREHVGATSARALRGLPGTEIVELGHGVAVADAVADLKGRDGVAVVQPDYVYRPEAVPDDASFFQQWGLNNTGQTVNGTAGTPDADIDAPEAWDVTTGSDTLVVGVIDTGFNTQHPDLAPNIFVNAAEAAGTPGVDDDANGRIDDVTGFDFVNHNGVVSDDIERHGSLVASVIGQRGANGIGGSGVAQRVRILPLQAVTPLGGVATSAASEAIPYAKAMGARIINMSFGDYNATPNAVLTAAMDAAPDILFTTSAGNDGTDNDTRPHWPSNLAATRGNVMATANTTSSDALSASSSYGATTVDVAAPGANIFGVFVPTDPANVFSENFSAGLPGSWSAGGAWNVAAEPTGQMSLTDSPGVSYGNNSDTAATSGSFPLPGNQSLTFCDVNHSRIRKLQTGDFYRVEVLVNGGAPVLIEQLDVDSAGTGFVSGSPGFARLGGTSAQLRFRLISNNDGIVNDGVHVDNIDVHCGPTTAAQYRFSGGTSFSSPATAGVAALILSINPGLTPSAVKALIRANVDPVPALAGKVVSNGRLNADKAVRAAAPPPPPPPPPPPDTRAALLSSYALLPATFRAFRAGASVRAAAVRRAPRPYGTRLRFRVDEAVRVRLQVHRRAAGRRVGRSCLAPTRARRRRPACTRYLLKGTYSMPGQLNGLVTRRFTGRIAGRALAPALYRLTLLATDLAGNRSLPARRNFRVVSR
jgi:subtilisin family serine protease